MELHVESLIGRPPDARRRAVAIGNFDGVHLGHLRLLQACVEAGRGLRLSPTVLTFDPHPASVVSDRGAPPRIQTLASRRRSLREVGIEDMAQLHFDRVVAGLASDDFVEQALVEGVHAGCVVVGQGFRFGAGRSGDVDTLRSLRDGRFEVVEVPILEDGGDRVSSSRIREALGRGDLAEAKRFLGRPYEIEGTVVHGDHRGQALGFPTANIDLEGVSALARGVYVVDGLIEGETNPRRATANLGVRPTFGGDEPRLEAHFASFQGDLYGRTVRLTFLARLRDERKFESLEDLKEQLVADIRTAAQTR